MIYKFIEYANQIFPTIDTNIKNGIIDYMQQFNTSKPNWFSQNLELISQGDILDNIIFTKVDDNGNEITFKSKGIVLSNTCDMTRDEYCIIAPLIPYTNKFNEQTKINIRNNIVSGKMCFTQSELEDYYVDFSMAQSMNRSIILKLIEYGRVNRIHSLSQFGFYFLCCKITIYYLRVDSNFNSRDNLCFIQ